MVKVLIQMIRTQRSSSQANSCLKINNLLEEKEREEYVCPKIEFFSDLLFFYTNLFPLSLVNWDKEYLFKRFYFFFFLFFKAAQISIHDFTTETTTIAGCFAISMAQKNFFQQLF